MLELIQLYLIQAATTAESVRLQYNQCLRRTWRISDLGRESHMVRGGCRKEEEGITSKRTGRGREGRGRALAGWRCS